jgi:Protein of unknown function (DUF3999)
MENKFKLCLLASSISLNLFSQINQFNYSRELVGIQDQWHKINLPNSIFQQLSPDLFDMRIYGITPENDTLEAPYILQIVEEKLVEKEIEFKTINQSKNEKGCFFTFEIPLNTPINEIELSFKEQNFDWKAALEGSQNQSDWFSIVGDYRILSIKNEVTNYQFSKLVFPNSTYKYYRLLIEKEKVVNLTSAKILLQEKLAGSYRKFELKSIKKSEEKENKQTVILTELQLSVPVSKVKIFANKIYDFYRPITIEFLSDSIKTEKGWIYNYQKLTTGLLNSIENNEFKFKSTVLKNLKISIQNNDNNPLQIDSIECSGFDHQLIVRFESKGKYFLAYGNTSTKKPIYDTQLFIDKIPKEPKLLILGDEKINVKNISEKTTPLFKSEGWLWVIMGIIIILLGWFSIKMIKNK